MDTGKLRFAVSPFLALFSIWQHITKGNDQGQRDLGLFWLSVAILVWALSGVLEVYYAEGLADANFDSTQYEGLKSMLSIFNSAFILLALPRFRHVPKLIRPVVRSESWRWVGDFHFWFLRCSYAFDAIRSHHT